MDLSVGGRFIDLAIPRFGGFTVQFSCSFLDDLVKSRNFLEYVIPANPGSGPGQAPESSYFKAFWTPAFAGETTQKSPKRWLRKKPQMQGTQFLRSERTYNVRRSDEGEAQSRPERDRWTFYAAIFLDFYQNINLFIAKQHPIKNGQWGLVG